MVSAPLDRRGVTSAMVLTGAGFLAGATMLGFLDQVQMPRQRRQLTTADIERLRTEGRSD